MDVQINLKAPDLLKIMQPPGAVFGDGGGPARIQAEREMKNSGRVSPQYDGLLLLRWWRIYRACTVRRERERMTVAAPAFMNISFPYSDILAARRRDMVQADVGGKSAHAEEIAAGQMEEDRGDRCGKREGKENRRAHIRIIVQTLPGRDGGVVVRAQARLKAVEKVAPGVVDLVESEIRQGVTRCDGEVIVDSSCLQLDPEPGQGAHLHRLAALRAGQNVFMFRVGRHVNPDEWISDCVFVLEEKSE